MPENRSRKHHQERLGDALREEIASIVEGELADPRITPASVSEVHLAQHGRIAYVWVAVHGGDEAQARSALDGLTAAKNYIRHEVAQRLGLRTAPEIIFELDRAFETRIDELLHRISKRKRSDAAKE